MQIPSNLYSISGIIRCITDKWETVIRFVNRRRCSSSQNSLEKLAVTQTMAADFLLKFTSLTRPHGDGLLDQENSVGTFPMVHRITFASYHGLMVEEIASQTHAASSTHSAIRIVIRDTLMPMQQVRVICETATNMNF